MCQSTTGTTGDVAVVAASDAEWYADLAYLSRDVVEQRQLTVRTRWLGQRSADAWSPLTGLPCRRRELTCCLVCRQILQSIDADDWVVGVCQLACR